MTSSAGSDIKVGTGAPVDAADPMLSTPPADGTGAAEEPPLPAAVQDVMARLDLPHSDAVVVDLDPAAIQPARWMRRTDAGLADWAFEELKSSIRASGGNLVPVLVRPLEGAKFELIYGGRRLRACMQLGLPVRAVVLRAAMSEVDCFMIADAENRVRKDLSLFERGLSYREAIDQEMFASQRKLAEELGISHTAVGQALTVARLPREVFDCVSSSADIGYRHAKAIADALARDFETVMSRVRELARKEKRLKPAQLVAELKGAVQTPVERGDIVVGTMRVGHWSLKKGTLQISLKDSQMTKETIQHSVSILAQELLPSATGNSRPDAKLPTV